MSVARPLTRSAPHSQTSAYLRRPHSGSRNSLNLSRSTRALSIKMGPPIPPNPSQLGHRLGGKDPAFTIDVFLDYTCPFSAKAYRTLVSEVAPHYGDKMSLVFRHQIQPWHPQSTLVHEAALAVTKVGGEDAFWKFSSALMAEEHEKDFYDVSTYDKTRGQIYDELAELASTSAGVDKAKVLEMLTLDKEALAQGQKNPGNAVTQDLKWEVKYSRMVGMHVSPTTIINGMVVDTSSGWTLDQWTQLLNEFVTV